MSVRSLIRIFLAVLWLWPATALAQVEEWQSHMVAGVQAYQQGNYLEAEKQLAAAVKEAEGFGPQDPTPSHEPQQPGGTLSCPGQVRRASRSTSAPWQALGPEHPNVALSLENYAALLRKTGRTIEATEMEARAKAIRTKHARENPVK